MRPTYILLATRRHERKEMYVQYAAEFHMQVLFQYGVVPLIVPSMAEIEPSLDHFVEMASGLLIVEGKDVHPDRYNPPIESRDYVRSNDVNRDKVEFALTEAAYARNLPILGICRGGHIMNIAAGGDLWTDVHADRPDKSINHIDYENYHGYRHTIRIEPDTWLSETYQHTRELPVNSYHHQAVKTLAQRFEPMAYCTDGVLEAFRDPAARFAVGLQFHPERMQGEHAGHSRVYQEFVEAAKAYNREASRLRV